MATVSVLIVLPTGIINGWSILPSLGALTGTLYGQLLLTKVSSLHLRRPPMLGKGNMDEAIGLAGGCQADWPDASQ